MTFIRRDRGFNQFMVFLPGWAMGHEIFLELDLPYNYIFVENQDLRTIGFELKEYMDEHSIPSIDLFGFSMGGFCAFEIMKSDLLPVKKIFFAGIRKHYHPAIIQEVKKYILQNKKAYLSRFYRQCFYQRKNFIRYKDLFETFMEKFSETELIQGLDYLASHSVRLDEISEKYSVFLYHGSEDLIAPLGEISLLDSVKKKVIPYAGHLFWLESSQEEWWRN